MSLSLCPITRKLAFVSSQPQTLTQIIGGLTKPIWVGSVTLRCGSNNIGEVHWQDPNGQIGGFLEAREAATIEFGGTFISDRLKFSGTTNDVIYLTIAVPVSYFDQGVIS